MKSATRLTSKGQVVIPKSVRDRLRWKKGTRLQVEPTSDGAVILRPKGAKGDLEALIDELSGCLNGYGRDPLADLEAEHQAEIERDERRARRRR
jgi:AbrB family looped-hinge helix DNA binding protein